MPLVKDLNVGSDLCGDTFRRKEFIVQKDFVRRFEMDREVSIRVATMKSSILIATLREISEPEVQITEEAQQAYADAEDWLCRRMNVIFHQIRGMGMQPKLFKKTIAAYMEGNRDPMIAKGCNLIWVPMCATYIGDERVYLFRVMPEQMVAAKASWGMANSGAIGYTREYLNRVSPELANYIAKLESKAMQDESVRDSFTRLGAILRPKQFKEEQIAERARAYADKGDEFGGWA
ncbi:hypothetical protein hairong_066 [Pseudomonas phage hairong]|nr:hypothetical protein hairong_066 [Pseudomonas phage hairong]